MKQIFQPLRSGLRPGLLESCLLAFALLAVVGVVGWVDLSPRVESDFFFSTDDPQLQASREIGERFPGRAQILLRAAPGEDSLSQSAETQPAGIRSPAYQQAVGHLTEQLAALPGVAGVQSLTQGPATPAAALASPFWSRLLVAPEEAASYLVVGLEDEGSEGTVREIETLLRDPGSTAGSAGESALDVEISGVPYVVELIRRSLRRDLRVFSLLALAVFGLLIAFLFRSWRITAGALAACLTACALTLALLALWGVSIGVLTANLVTIVFVLTLSHTVFLTTNWRRLVEEEGWQGAEARAVRLTFGASFWCMTTTLLGFLSLLTASARPLRELGTAGALGTVVAIAVAYLFYPPFLRQASSRPLPLRLSGGALSRPLALALIFVAMVVGSGLLRLDADPSLLSYFRPGSEIRQGLVAIDADGGSSPLSLLVSDPQGERLDTPEAVKRLDALQEALEVDPSTGTVLSVSPLLAEARQANPMAAFLPPRTLLDILSQPAYQRVALSFVSEDRLTAHFFLRMREGGTGSDASRAEVMARLEEAVRGAGLQPSLTGGLYELQARLSSLVAGSLLRGLGGLVLLFALIGFWVSRSWRTTGAMVFSLLLVPLFLLGAMGYLGMPIDFISSPAAQVAIAIGVDSMIHLAAAVRRARAGAGSRAQAWDQARTEIAPAILTASALVALGFGLFAFSSFPPTQRFGFAVCLGTLGSAAVALWVMPVLASGRAQAR